MIEEIKNAIILAAGQGTRLRPYTDTIPKPLLKIHGEPLLETLIKQLYANKIETISIVVGYMANQFEYLRDKYGVNIVYNEDYMKMNNISSLYCVRDKLTRATMIMDADLIITDPSVLRKYVSQSGYSCYWTDERINEWGLDLYYTDIIHCNREFAERNYALKSLSFWTSEDCKKLAKYLTTAFLNLHPDVFWDDIPLFICPNEFNLCAYKTTKDAILEIDTVEEYERLK